MAVRHVLALYLSLASMTVEVTSQNRRCSQPTWPSDLDLEDPVSTNRGKVVLVALMKGYCGYCVNQAQSLENLQTRLARQGYPDIEMVLVNGGGNHSRINIHNLQNAASFPVLQDTEEHVLFNQVFNGSKDDFIVYDRCGQRAFHIPHPYSFVGYNITERVLKFTYRGRQTCYCRLDRQAANFRDRMQGDQPMSMPLNEEGSTEQGSLEGQRPRFNFNRRRLARLARREAMMNRQGRRGGSGRRRHGHRGHRHQPGNREHKGRRHQWAHPDRRGHRWYRHHGSHVQEGASNGDGLQIIERGNPIGGAGRRPDHRRQDPNYGPRYRNLYPSP